MKKILRAALACLIIANAAIYSTANAQTATASTNISCVQSGVSMTCTQQPVVFTLPSGVTLAAQTSGNSITLTGSSGPVAPSSCSITPANPNVAIGGTVTLTVSCQVGSGGYTYAWTKAGNAVGGNSASYPLSSTLDTATASTTTYSVTVTNTAGTSTASTNVLVAAANPPSGCSINATATTVTTGATPTLSVSCTGGTAPFTYQWTKAGNTIGTNQSYTLSDTTDTAVAGTPLFAVNVTNNAGTATASVQIQVTTSQTSTCPVGALTYVMSSTNSNYIDTSGQYGETPVSVTMDIASTTTTTGSSYLPQLWWYESPSYPESIKEVTISRSPCNFTSPEFVVAAPSAYKQGGWVKVLLNDTRVGAYPRLTTGRWYINLRSTPNSCAGLCNTRIYFTP